MHSFSKSATIPFLDRWVAGPDAPDQADPPSENAWRCILHLLPFDWHADVVHRRARAEGLHASRVRGEAPRGLGGKQAGELRS